MSRQRKQKLSVREYEEPAEGERNHDPFLAGAATGGSSPLGLSLETHDLDVTPEHLDDGQLSSFIDTLGDDPLELGAIDSSTQEIFQYLRYTSTPKRDPFLSTDSGLHLTTPSPLSDSTKKRIRFSGCCEEISDLSWSSSTGGKPCSVLLDITGDNSLYRRAAGADSFVNIADADLAVRLQQRGSENCRTESSGERGKRVSIIRRNLSAKKSQPLPQPGTGIFEREFSSGGPHRYSALERKKVAYYTGVEDWDAAASLLTRFRLPEHEGVSADRVVLMTLMRLRLHLEWKDLAFRFDTSEETVVRLFKAALETMAECLSEELGWSGPAVRQQVRPRFLYIHPVTFMGERSVEKILVAITGGKRPVLYVSRSYPSDADSVTVLAREAASRLVTGDILCTREGHEEQGQDEAACWRVERGILRRLRPSNLSASLAHVSEPLKRLKQFKMFSGRFTATETVTRHIVTLIAALVNIDSSSATSQVGPNNRHEDFGQLRL